MFNKKLKGSLFSQKWFLLFALLVVLAIPVIIYAAINNNYQQYRIYSQENKPINPRLSDNVSVASIPTCVINRSSQDYFVPNNSSNEITKFLGAVEKATVSGTSYLKSNATGAWSWAGDKASSTGICQDGICVPGVGENYVSDPQECCLTSSCGNKQCGDDQCGGDCITIYKAATGGTVKDSSGYIFYATQPTQDNTQKCYIFTSDGAAPSTKPHYYTCSNGSFSGDGSEETCGFHTTSTIVLPTTPASCHGDSVCVTMPDKVSCNNVTNNSGGHHLCSWY